MTYDGVCWVAILLIGMIIARGWLRTKGHEGFASSLAPAMAPAPAPASAPASSGAVVSRVPAMPREEAHWLFA